MLVQLPGQLVPVWLEWKPTTDFIWNVEIEIKAGLCAYTDTWLDRNDIIKHGDGPSLCGLKVDL